VRVLVISVISRIVKSSGSPLDPMALTQHLGDLLDGYRNLLSASGGNQNLVDVCKAHRHRIVGSL